MYMIGRKGVDESGWRAVSGERPEATGSMRRLLRMGEILALRGADDEGSCWLREYTTSCGEKEGPSGDTVSNLDVQITAPVTICQVIN